MNRAWNTPDEPPPPPPPPPATPRRTVPRPAHARLRTAAIEIFGLDSDCTDNAIILAMLEHAPR